MVEIQPLNHWAFQIANSFLIISFIQWNQLYLRFTISCGCFFFMLWGIIFFDIAVDLSTWNFVLCCLSTSHIVLILRKKIVGSFELPLENLYQKVFSGVLTRYEFKLFKSCIEVQEVVAPNTQILKAGNTFEEILIIGDLDPEKTKIEIKVNTAEGERTLTHQVDPYTWLGVIDYIQMTQTPNSPQKSGITVDVTQVQDKLYVFRINVDQMHSLFQNKTHGMSLQNGIMSKMLGFVAGFIVSLDMKYLEAKQQFQRDPNIQISNFDLE